MLKVSSGDRTYQGDFNDRKRQNGTVNNNDFSWDSVTLRNGVFHIVKDNVSYNAEVVNANHAEKSFAIKVNGVVYELSVKDKYDELLEKMGIDPLAGSKVSELKAPMPGLVLNVMQGAGNEVKKGDPLLVLEAMKMENVIKSPADGVIKKVAVETGTAVEKNEVLIEFA